MSPKIARSPSPLPYAELPGQRYLLPCTLLHHGGEEKVLDCPPSGEAGTVDLPHWNQLGQLPPL